MTRVIFVISVLIYITGCTKEVPESDRRLVRSAEETAVQKLIDNYYTAYNNGDIETAISLCDNEFQAIIQDEDESINLLQFEKELQELYSQYPEGKWQVNIEELSVQNDLAYVITKASFFLPDAINEELSAVYSERAIRILKKNKPDGWKIFRLLSVQIFS